MKALLILVTIFFSSNALAQAAPKGTSKPVHQVKPKEPMGCKLVGTVRGTKLWAGDCVASSDLRGGAPTDEPATPATTPEANPPAAKQ
jgi:hypothetical protein